MKHLFYLLTLLLILSCSPHTNRFNQLKVIEESINGNLDTALILLKQERPNYSAYSKQNKMYYLLIQTEAMNRAFMPLDTISYMSDVVGYFSSNGDNHEKMRANYMMGCVQRDKGNSPLAIKFYNDAISYADTTLKDCDYRQLTKIYSQMGYIFHLQRFPKKELEVKEKALQAAIKTKDTMMIINCKDKICDAYIYQNDDNLFFKLTNDIYNTYKKMGREDKAARTASSLLKHYLQQKDYQTTKHIIDEYLTKANSLDSHGMPLYPGAEFIYFYQGKYYEGVAKTDSALIYYYKLLQYNKAIDNIENGYKGLMSVYHTLKNTDSIVKYTTLYADLNDTVNLRNSAQEVSKMQALYDYSEAQNLAIQKDKESQKLTIALLYTSITITVLICFTIVGIRIYQIKQKKAKNELKEVNKRYIDALYKCEEIKTDLRTALTDFKQFKKEKEKEIKTLRLVIESYQDEASSQQWDFEHELLHLPIVERLHELAKSAQKATEAEWTSLEQTCQKHLPQFISSLRATPQKLNEVEFLVCLLTRLEFIPSELTVLLGLSNQRINNLRRNLNNQLFGDNTSTTFNANIRHLVC